MEYRYPGVSLEKIIEIGGFRSLVYEPWREIPGLVQGVTVKPAAGMKKTAADEVVRHFRRDGFAPAPRIRQVHGKRVIVASALEDTAAGEAPEADGLACARAGVLGLVSVADCVPVFMVEPAQGAWALVHSGWRGTVAGAVENGIERLEELTGSTPDQFELYFGPAVCGSCYEVGPEVARLLSGAAAGAGIIERSGRISADLRVIQKARAVSRGVRPAEIHISSFCTICHNDRFCSYRAEGAGAVRGMWAYLGRKDESRK